MPESRYGCMVLSYQSWSVYGMCPLLKCIYWNKECLFETCASWDIMLPKVRLVGFILSSGVLN
jgi:hypothetical protein